jgi:hypothetical protein
VVHTCDLSYTGDVGRRIEVWGQPWAKTQYAIWKITKSKKGWWSGSHGRASTQQGGGFEFEPQHCRNNKIKYGVPELITGS